MKRPWKKIGLLATAAFLCCSCTYLEDARIPVDDVAGVTEAIGPALKSSDLNADGEISGMAEWLALINATVYAYHEAKR